MSYSHETEATTYDIKDLLREALSTQEKLDAVKATQAGILNKNISSDAALIDMLATISVKQDTTKSNTALDAVLRDESLAAIMAIARDDETSHQAIVSAYLKDTRGAALEPLCDIVSDIPVVADHRIINAISNRLYAWNGIGDGVMQPHRTLRTSDLDMLAVIATQRPDLTAGQEDRLAADVMGVIHGSSTTQLGGHKNTSSDTYLSILGSALECVTDLVANNATFAQRLLPQLAHYSYISADPHSKPASSDLFPQARAAACSVVFENAVTQQPDLLSEPVCERVLGNLKQRTGVICHSVPSASSVQDFLTSVRHIEIVSAHKLVPLDGRVARQLHDISTGLPHLSAYPDVQDAAVGLLDVITQPLPPQRYAPRSQPTSAAPR